MLYFPYHVTYGYQKAMEEEDDIIQGRREYQYNEIDFFYLQYLFIYINKEKLF